LYDRDTENSARMPKYAKDDGKISAPDERLIIAVPGSKALSEIQGVSRDLEALISAHYRRQKCER
jgi:hypothetical protein